jgi:FixJ family two-component response regulator
MLAQVLGALGITVVGFGSAHEFLQFGRGDGGACLVLSLESADREGITARLCELAECPIIVVTRHSDIPSAVKAMRAGAVDFLIEPVDANALLESIRRALDRDIAVRAREAQFATLRRRFDTLTPREREVLALVIGGMRNKQAAAALGIGEVTLQIHRRHATRKMSARSFADLVRMGIALGVAAEIAPVYRSLPVPESLQRV